MSEGQVVKAAVRNFLGPIRHLWDDPSVTEVLMNGYQDIFVERGGKLEKTEAQFPDEDSLLTAIVNIAHSVNRQISEENPRLDARLEDGSRVAAVIRPCARSGPTLSIRKFTQSKITMKDYIQYGAVTQDAAQFLDICMYLGKNILVSGGTGSGKTTLLGLLCSRIPKGQRIIVIEDASELKIQYDHVVFFETKMADAQGKGLVSMKDLLNSSLRLRPDRIIVGEVRSSEALELINAMNTGHKGCLGTVHANSPEDAIVRLEGLAQGDGSSRISEKALRYQVSSALDLVVQISRYQDGSRRIAAISEILGLLPDGSYNVVPIYEMSRMVRRPDGKLGGQLEPTGNKPSFLEEIKDQGLPFGEDKFRHPGAGRGPGRGTPEGGFSAILMIMASLMSLYLTYLFSGAYIQFLGKSKQDEIRSNLISIRDRYLTILEDPRSWYNSLYEYRWDPTLGKNNYVPRGLYGPTISNYKTFQCFLDPSISCIGKTYTGSGTSTSEYIFQLYDSKIQDLSNGNIASPSSQPYETLVDPNTTNGFYNSGGNSGTWGYTYTGNTCSTFSQNGNDDCPFQVQLTWKPVCDNGPCTPSSISPAKVARVRLRFAYSPKPGNTKDLGIDLNQLEILRDKPLLKTSLVLPNSGGGVVYAESVRPPSTESTDWGTRKTSGTLYLGPDYVKRPLPNNTFMADKVITRNISVSKKSVAILRLNGLAYYNRWTSHGCPDEPGPWPPDVLDDTTDSWETRAFIFVDGILCGSDGNLEGAGTKYSTVTASCSQILMPKSSPYLIEFVMQTIVSKKNPQSPYLSSGMMTCPDPAIYHNYYPRISLSNVDLNLTE